MSDDRYTACAREGRPLEGFVMDAHMHLGEQSGFHILHHGDLDLFVREMDRHGVDAGGVSSIPACLGGVQPGGNEMVTEAVRRFPDRIFGWTAVNPFYPESMRDELERCYDAGCRGVKLHDSIGLPYDHENYRIALDFAAERGAPVLLHTWGTNLGLLEPYFTEYAGVKWSLAHAGCSDPDKYVRAALEHENVYVDICLSSSPRGLIEWLVEQGIAEKVMFSSDSYFMGEAQQLGRVVFAKVSEEHKAMILGGNARRFFGDLCPG